MKRDKELDREAIAAAVMADIEGAAGDGLRDLLWRRWWEGFGVGAVAMAFLIIIAYSVTHSSMIVG